MPHSVRALASAGALALCCAAAAPPASARTLDYWVAAVPTSWNIAPNGRDAIMGTADRPRRRDLPDGRLPPLHAALGQRRWPNAPRASADGLLIPGPLIHARVGDRLRIHFKNMDTLRHDPHSMHFHGVHYRPELRRRLRAGLLRPRRRREVRPDAGPTS